MVYQWKKGSCFKANANKCKVEIDTLVNKTAKNIVNLARNRKTELHKCFEWDDTKAAEKWRLNQAQRICCSFEVIEIDPVTKKEYFVKVFEKDSNKHGAPYREVTEALNDEVFKKVIVNRVKNEIDALEREAVSYQKYFTNPTGFKKAMKTARKAV
jgi:tRNA A37 N6-isopentenylltransferase MiaA